MAGDEQAMYNIGFFYEKGRGVPKDLEKMLDWYEQSARAGYIHAQKALGLFYYLGTHGIGVDRELSCKWLSMGAAQDDRDCLFLLGSAYSRGEGVARDPRMAVRLWRRAAEQGQVSAQFKMGAIYGSRTGLVLHDWQQSYIWHKLAAKQGDKEAEKFATDLVARFLTAKQIAEANEKIAAFVPRPRNPGWLSGEGERMSKAGRMAEPAREEYGPGSGTGFFITKNGYIVTSYHLVRSGKEFRVVRGADKGMPAQLMAHDKNADLAILKIAAGDYPFLPIASPRGVKLGASVATVGFPNPDVQGLAPKLSRGEIASLTGVRDDPNRFQISAPLQPGNSGGGLVDMQGNVVGVVCAGLDQSVALATSGTLASNVAYAVKSSLLLNLVETVPGLADQLPAAAASARPFEAVVSDVQDATVLIIVE